MKSLLAMLSLLFVLPALSAQAEIVKSSIPCKTGTCLYWHPQVPSPAGWRQDREASDNYGINAQSPDGATFATAESVIYAKAIYKPLLPTLTSLAVLIESDRKDFLARDPQLTITDAEALTTGDGRLLKSFHFAPGDTGNWEQVSYGEEGEFYLIFTVSSPTRAGLTRTQESYRQFVGNYREKP